MSAGTGRPTPPLDWRAKGWPALDGEVGATDVARAGWNLFDGRFLLPTMVIRESALAHDIELMASWTQAAGVSLAPHGKTTMCPPIWRRQLDAGAWAITLATPWQARAAVIAGVPRIVLANEVVDEAGIDWLGSLLDAGEIDLITQVDTVEGVERLATLLGERSRRLPVLVEAGVEGGRTGTRTIDDARAVIAAVAAAPNLAVAGATCFEGILGPDERDRVTELVGRVREVGVLVAPEAERAGRDELILSGGGSIHFTTVRDVLAEPLDDASLPVRVVIRSGCTVTHDHVGYDVGSPFGTHAPPGAPRLEPALEVWADVVSVPEAGYAYANAGKRDLPYDAGLPAVIAARHPDGRRTTPGATVTGLNDQHAFLRLEPGAELAVGDRIAFGIGHPCSAFDRWRMIPVVDDGYDVIDAYETIF